MSNAVDRDLEMAEVDANAQRRSSDWGDEKPRQPAEAPRPSTSGSASTMSSSGSSSSVEYNPNVHRLQSRNTEVDLERRRSNLSQALSRIETQRLQHSMTVGESVKSRPSKLPLPPMGAGKPYPPQLPDREDYVVEFDGPDDPLYPQNWSLKTKYVYPPRMTYLNFPVPLFMSEKTDCMMNQGMDRRNACIHQYLFHIRFRHLQRINEKRGIRVWSQRRGFNLVELSLHLRLRNWASDLGASV